MEGYNYNSAYIRSDIEREFAIICKDDLIQFNLLCEIEERMNERNKKRVKEKNKELKKKKTDKERDRQKKQNEKKKR